MAYSQKQLGALASQLAEALDDLALAVESFRIREQNDPKVVRALQITEQAISKAKKESLN